MYDDTDKEVNPSKEEGGYFRDWYAVNGGALNRDRQRRYRDDPDYRTRVLKQNRDARKRKRDAMIAERRLSPGRVRVERSWKTRDMTVTLEDGTQATVKGFTIGAVAAILGCSVQALRLWEKEGVLPPTAFRYAGRDRLYTSDMIDIYRTILAEHWSKRLDPGRTRPRPLLEVRRQVRFSDGETRDVQLYRIGVLAQRANRTVVTLEQLEQRGYLPETPFRASELGYRLYTRPMISAVASAFAKRAGEIRGADAWGEFHAEVLGAWKSQGVVGARILKRRAEPK